MDAEDGLNFTILVGAGKEADNVTLVRITGELRRVTMGKASVPMTFHETTTTAVELPAVAVRSICTDLPVRLGKLTVLSVLDGFVEGECVVVASSIRKVDQP